MKVTTYSFRWIQTFILVLAASWIAYTSTVTKPSEIGKTPSPRQGFPAPEFTLDTLSEESINLHDFRGKVVVLNFWASWCPPCKAEMPAFEALQQAYRTSDVIVLAINTTYQDDLAAATQFVEENHLSFPILFDNDGKVTNTYQVLAMPSSFFIDRQGVIRQVIIGGPISEALIQTQVRRLLQESP